MNEDIKVNFIIPRGCKDENDCSDEMQLAFISCQQHCAGGLSARWVHEDVYNEFEGLTKQDVFVISDFDGRLYNKLKTTKCLLVGPRCLSCCLTEGTPIPSGPEPVFTVAMRGLVVTASGLSKHKKEELKKKVHWMGGIYSTVLTEDTTHLVSNTVLSDKYKKSVEKGIPIMSETWINAVWETSLRLNVNGASSDFNDHRLPTFANLQVTTSGINKKEKQNIMKLITENGGTFSGAFQSETTDIVILTKLRDCLWNMAENRQPTIWDNTCSVRSKSCYSSVYYSSYFSRTSVGSPNLRHDFNAIHFVHINDLMKMAVGMGFATNRDGGIPLPAEYLISVIINDDEAAD